MTKRSRVRTLVIALVIALISRVTGDMLLSRSSYGKAFGNPLAGERSALAFGGRFRPTSIRAKATRRGVSADGHATFAVARSLAPSGDARSWATLPEPLSAPRYAPSPVSLIGPLPVDGNFLNGPPGGDVGPTPGGGPGGGPFVGGPPTGFPPGGGGGGFVLPPGGGGSGGGSGSPPVVGVPEPSDWSMMVFGLLAAGVPLRLSPRAPRGSGI